MPASDFRVFDVEGHTFVECARCGSEAEYVECPQCAGDGVYGHHCGEDTCCCPDPEEDAPCPTCDGGGGWHSCLAGCDSTPHGREG